VHSADTFVFLAANLAHNYLGNPVVGAIASVLIIGAGAFGRNFFVDADGWHRRQVFVGTDLSLAFLGVGLGTLFSLFYRYLFTKLVVQTAVILGAAASVGFVLFFLMFMAAVATEKVAHKPGARPSLNLLLINLITGALPLGGALALFSKYLGHSL